MQQRARVPATGPDPANRPADDCAPGELLTAALAGDQVQWRRLVDRYTPLLRSVVAGYRLGDEGADVVQSTFMRLMERGAGIRIPDALASWLVTTARNECLRVLRQRRRVVLLADLPVRQRTLLRLLSQADRPDYRRVAAAAGVPIGSVGPTRRRGLERLRRELAGVYGPICA